MFCDFPKYKHTKQTIYRGVGGGGNATTDAEISTIAALNTLGAASATASAASATQAATSAGSASTSATAAGASASTATTQASAASSSASSASTSAGTATTQASAASSSASAAATSAANAAASAASIAGGPVASVAGLTGTVSSAALKTATALNNVDNTSDANKPISSLTATALAGKQASGSYATGSGTANGTNTGDQTITLTGGVTGTGTGSFAATVVTNANLTGAIISVGNAASLGSFTSANLAAALTDETGTGANVFANSPNLVTPALGTPASGVATNLTGLPLTTGVTGTLAVTNGGTGNVTGTTTINANSTGAITSLGNATSLGSFTSANLATALTDETGTGAAVFANSPNLVTPALGTPASGVATNLTGLPLTTGVTGTLPVGNGGTGVTTSTGSGNNVLSTSPNLTTPALGTPTALVGTNITGTAAAFNINGTVGATTPTTGDFTNVSYTGTLTGGTGIVNLGAGQVYKDASGNLLVGKTTTATTTTGWSFGAGYGNSKLSVGNYFIFNRDDNDILVNFRRSDASVGTITVTTSTTAYNTSSDYRLKESIAPMTGALAKVLQLKPCTYKWKSDGSDGQGFIAHELEEVVHGCVTGEKDAVDDTGKPKYQGIDTSFLIATLTSAIQELKVLVDAQASRITALEAR